MNEKVKGIVDKICAGATVAGEFAAKTATSAGKKATDVYNASKINLKIFDLTTDIDVLYKDVGRMLYATHCNEDVSTDALEERLHMIDEKNEELALLRAELTEIKDCKKCPACGKLHDKSCLYCSSCGEKLPE